MDVIAVTDQLTILTTMKNPTAAPYGFFDEFGVQSFTIKNMSGKAVLKGNVPTMSQLVNGQANINIPLENLPAGNYTLVIDAFVGAAKADQPLVIYGNWVCEFTR